MNLYCIRQWEEIKSPIPRQRAGYRLVNNRKTSAYRKRVKKENEAPIALNAKNKAQPASIKTNNQAKKKINGPFKKDKRAAPASLYKSCDNTNMKKKTKKGPEQRHRPITRQQAKTWMNGPRLGHSTRASANVRRDAFQLDGRGREWDIVSWGLAIPQLNDLAMRHRCYLNGMQHYWLV